MMQNINDMYDKNGISFDSDRHMICPLFMPERSAKKRELQKRKKPGALKSTGLHEKKVAYQSHRTNLRYF